MKEQMMFESAIASGDARGDDPREEDRGGERRPLEADESGEDGAV